MAGLVDELFIKLGFKVDDKPLEKTKKEVNNTAKNMLRLATMVIGAAIAFNHLSMSLARNNQQFINFTRQTGLAIRNLNEVLGAGMALDVNFSPETAVSGIKALQRNLEQIKIGQGNITPFQMLGISPVGKDAFDVLEDLRIALRGVDDAMASYLLNQMGLSEEFLPILRLTREEYENLTAQTQKYLLSEEERKGLQKYGEELRMLNQELTLLKDRLLLEALPNVLLIFKTISKGIKDIWTLLEYLSDWINNITGGKNYFTSNLATMTSDLIKKILENYTKDEGIKKPLENLTNENIIENATTSSSNLANVNNNKTVTQNNYLNFEGGNSSTVANAINELQYTMIQADGAV